MPPVVGAASYVVDRGGRVGDLLRERICLRKRGRDEDGPRTRRSERRSQLPTRREGERADRDHHRVARPDLHERLRCLRGAQPHGGDQLVGLESGLLDAGDELGETDAALSADRDAFDLGTLDQQRRQRITGRGSGGEVASDRAAIPDLRRADGA